jgi:hypothetical protein
VIWRRSGQIERFNGAVTTVVGSAETTPIGFDVSPHGPSINNSGVSVFSATHAVLYLYDRGALEVVAAPGNPSPGVGTLGSIIVPAIRRSSLAFAAVDGGGSLIALKKGRNAPIQVLHSGDPAPGGGTFNLGSNLIDVTGSKVLFQSALTGGVAPSGLFRVNTQTGQIDTLALQGDMAPSGAFFQTFLAIHAASSEAAFVATLTGFVDGIFLTSHLGLRQVVLEGDVSPDTGGGTLADLGRSHQQQSGGSWAGERWHRVGRPLPLGSWTDHAPGIRR